MDHYTGPESMHCVKFFIIKILRRKRCTQWTFQTTTPKRDINIFSWHCLELITKNSNFPFTRKTKVYVSQIAHWKRFCVFQSSCVLCVLHCDFFCHTLVNLSVDTAMTTKITFDEFVKPKPTFSVWLDTSRVWFFLWAGRLNWRTRKTLISHLGVVFWNFHCVHRFLRKILMRKRVT